MAPVLLVAALLVVCHEAGHILSVRAFGGHIQRLVFRGFAVGVALSLDGLSTRERLWTAWAGPLAEGVGAGVIAILTAVGACSLHLLAWTCAVAAVNAGLNLGPWWAHNDGALIRRWSQSAHTLS